MARKKVTEPLAPILPDAAPAAPPPVAPAAASPYGPTIPPLADAPAPKAKAPRAPKAPKVPPVVAPPVAVAPPPAPPAIGGVPAIHDPIGDLRNGIRVGAVRLEDGAPPAPKVPGVREPASKVNARIKADPAFQPPPPPPRSIPNTPPNAAGFREPIVPPPPPPGTGFKIVPQHQDLAIRQPAPGLPAVRPTAPPAPGTGFNIVPPGPQGAIGARPQPLGLPAPGPYAPNFNVVPPGPQGAIGTNPAPKALAGPGYRPPAAEPEMDALRAGLRADSAPKPKGSRVDARLAAEFPMTPGAPAPATAPAPVDFETAMGNIRAAGRGPMPPAPKAPIAAARPKTIPYRVGQAVRGYGPMLAAEVIADPDAAGHAVAHPIETAGKVYGGLQQIGRDIPDLKQNLGNIYGGLTHENPAVREATRVAGLHAVSDSTGLNKLTRIPENIATAYGAKPTGLGDMLDRRDGGSEDGDNALWRYGTTKQVFDEALRQATNREDPRFQHYAQPHSGPFPGDNPGAAKQAGAARYAAERNAVLAAKSAQTGQPFTPYGGSAATSEPYQPYGPGGPTIYAPAGEDPTLGFEQSGGFRSMPPGPPAQGGPGQPPPPPVPAGTEASRPPAGNPIGPMQVAPPVYPDGRPSHFAGGGPSGGQSRQPSGPVPGGIPGRSSQSDRRSASERTVDPVAGMRANLVGLVIQNAFLHPNEAEIYAKALGALPGYGSNSDSTGGSSGSSVGDTPFHFPDPTADAKAEHLLSEAALNRSKAGVFDDPTKFEGAALMSGVDPAAAAAYGQRMRNMQPLPPGAEHNPAHFDSVLAQRLPGALGAFGKMTPDMNVGTAASSLMDSGLFADGKINSPEEIAAARKLGQIFGVDAIQSELGTNPSTSWIPGMSDRDVPQRKRARSFLEQIMELLNGGPGEGASPGMPQTPAGFF